MSAVPEQPKKVTGGAFGRFLAAHRPALQEECKGKPAPEVVKLASARFKALSETERAEWEQKNKDAQAQYEKDMEAFLAAGGEKKVIQKRKGSKDDDESPKKKAKKEKDPEAPKRPAGGAYGCFLAKNREAFAKECEGKPVTAVSKLAGERWKDLSAEDRKPFEEEYQAKLAAYQEAMKTYTPPVTAPEDTDSPPKAEMPPKVKRAAASAKKTAPSDSPQSKLEDAVAMQAEKAGLTTTLLKLVARQDVIDSGKSQTAALKALQEHGGLLHPARRALLGA